MFGKFSALKYFFPSSIFKSFSVLNNDIFPFLAFLLIASFLYEISLDLHTFPSARSLDHYWLSLIQWFTNFLSVNDYNKEWIGNPQKYFKISSLIFELQLNSTDWKGIRKIREFSHREKKSLFLYKWEINKRLRKVIFSVYLSLFFSAAALPCDRCLFYVVFFFPFFSEK